MDNDIIRFLLTRAGRYPLLSPEKELEYSQQINDNKHLLEIPDEQLDETDRTLKRETRNTLNLFINSNLRLVINIAKKYNNSGVPFEELIQEGALGLKTAILKFDPTKGYRMSTYAYWWIKQAITRYVYNTSSTIRLPVHIVEKINKLSRIVRNYKKEKGFMPPRAYIAQKLDITEAKLDELLRYKQPMLSLNQIYSNHKDDSGLEFMETIIDQDAFQPEDFAENKSLINDINSALDILSSREQDIVMKKYGLYDGEVWSLQRIADSYNVSRERIRQILNQVLRKLKGNTTVLQSLRNYV